MPEGIMPITRQDAKHVAGLARLALTDDETDLYTAQMQRILAHVEKLSEVDTTGVEPTTHTMPPASVMREDRACDSMPQAGALGNAPLSARGCFKVPRIID